jgi:hypothetical protein
MLRMKKITYACRLISYREENTRSAEAWIQQGPMTDQRIELRRNWVDDRQTGQGCVRCGLRGQVATLRNPVQCWNSPELASGGGGPSTWPLRPAAPFFKGPLGHFHDYLAHQPKIE